jgi:hypothetical protein
MATRVKKYCAVFQACEHPNSSSKGQYEMNPIPPAPFMSLYVDIFPLTEVTWQDFLVLFVDWLSVWMIAQPTLKKGLTAEKCAHLLLDSGWTKFGVQTTLIQTRDRNLWDSGSKPCVVGLAFERHFHKPITPRPMVGPK